MRSCARRRRILPRRSSTAAGSDCVFRGRPSGRLWGRADLQGVAYRPSTYYAQKAREADPSKLPLRLRRDLELQGHIGRIWRENFSVYGVRKIWRQLQREEIPAARCTVMRLMRQMGLKGAMRGRKFKTTVSNDRDFRPADLVTRNFRADRPNRLWVVDLTYVAMTFSPRAGPFEMRVFGVDS